MENNIKSQKFDRFCSFLTQKRLGVLIAILVITGVFLYGSFSIQSEVRLFEMIPYDHSYLKLHARFSQIFGGGGQGVVIALKSKKGDIFNEAFLTKLQKMTNEVVMWDEVYRVLTTSIASRSVKVVRPLKKGEISVTSLMWPDVPKNQEEMELLKKNILSNPAYSGSLVSNDTTAALLLTEFRDNVSYQHAFGLLQKLRTEYSNGDTTVHIIGFPSLMGWIYSLKHQMYFVFAISIGLMILALYLMFRNVVGMIAPIVNALILTLIGLGFIGFTGINFSPLLYVLAFLVGARMVSNSVQITYRYFEELDASGNDRVRACYETMRSMFLPNFTAVITEAVGFLVLLLAKIILMQGLAIIMSFWMLSIVLTGFMVPAVCTLIPLKIASARYAKRACQTDRMSRVILKATQFSIGSGKYVVGGAVIVLLVFFAWEMKQLKIGDPTQGSPLLWPNHVYNQDQELINKLFNASSENLQLFYEGEKGSVYDPVVLTTFEAFSRHMKETLPDIYKSSVSLIDMVKMINVTLHDGDKLWYQLPQNATLLTGFLGYVRDGMDRGTLGRFIDGGLERSQITLFFSDHTSDNLLRIREAAYGFFKNRPMKVDKGEFKLAGGRLGMEIALNDEMRRSHVIIDTTVLVAIFIICSLAYWSITGGLMLTLPLIFANCVAYAYMSLANVGLSINTLPVAAIGVGVGVDFAIYIYSRCVEEFPLANGDWSVAILQSVCTSGKAVLYTGITTILPIITWYIFSDMKFQAQVGFFLAMIMGTNVILALTLHPLLIYIIKPRFISRGVLKTAMIVESKDAAAQGND